MLGSNPKCQAVGCRTNVPSSPWGETKKSAVTLGGDSPPAPFREVTTVGKKCPGRMRPQGTWCGRQSCECWERHSWVMRPFDALGRGG